MTLLVKDLKKGDRVKDKEDTYRCMSDPIEVHGVWQIEIVTGGDYNYTLRDDPSDPLEYDTWLEEVKARRNK